MENSTRGLILVHDAPAYLLKQIGWSVSHVLGYEANFTWNKQPLLDQHFRSELIWEGAAETGAHLASLLAGWNCLSFEVTQESSDGVSASRWLHSPSLGIKHRATDEVGNYLIGEEELRAAMARAGSNSLELHRELQNLLASPWEEALEPLRAAGADASVVWLFHAG